MTWLQKVKRDFVKEVSPYKGELEIMMYRQAGMISDMQIVSGPDIERHVRQGRDFVAKTSKSKIQIVELEQDVHYLQMEWMQSGDEMLGGSPCWTPLLFGQDGSEEHLYIGHEFMHIKDNLEIIHSDIASIEIPFRFIDADLMGSVDSSTGYAIYNTLAKQANYYPTATTAQLRKGFIFTAATRPVNQKDTLEWVKRLVGQTLGSVISYDLPNALTGLNTTIRTNGFRGVNVYHHGVQHFGGRVEFMDVFSYNEKGTPMVTGLIVYR